MFLLLPLLSLVPTQIAAATSPTQTPPSTIQQFLALPSVGPLAPFTKSISGFANEHVTALAASLSYVPSPTGTSSTTEYYGFLAVGFNDNEYSHYLSLSDTDDGYIGSSTYTYGSTFAYCTGTPTSHAVWTCNSSIVYIVSSENAALPDISTSTKTFPATTFTASDHLYEIGVGGILRPPE